MAVCTIFMPIFCAILLLVFFPKCGIIIIVNEREVFKMANTVQDAYRIVLNDILNSGCGLMVGEYDAKNGSEQFMHGISTVMEWIAYRVSDADGDTFSDLFIKNLIASEEKAKKLLTNNP
jgi:hypothetical protein